MPENADTRIYVLLADLFLDSELRPEDARCLAGAIQPTDFTIAEIEHKIKAHLFPVLYPNLAGAAGQWAGFDEDWLLPKIDDARRKEGSYVHDIWTNLYWYIYGGVIVSRWEAVKQYLQRPENM
ncbi:hypothetical protein E8E14_006157 [Neopestalotiopsis sp. 37M]|nr:hypothetical protein E8E14_006157 [Neopestalotiopsis sp. 37M]